MSRAVTPGPDPGLQPGGKFPGLALGLLVVFLAACSGPPERLEYNDPSRYTLAKDVLWASPGGIDLTMDIYSPHGRGESLPVIVMFHGGGWLINDNSIMRQAAAYLATHGRYVICNVNYRLLGDAGNTVKLNEIVEDAFGAVLWVKDNISRYGGNPGSVAVTGDSAGGHLSAMIVNRGDQLASAGLDAEPPGFRPSYLAPSLTPEALALRGGIEVQAAILSYGAFDIHATAREGFESWGNPFWLMGGALPRGVFGDEVTVDSHPALYRALSPLHHIPAAAERTLPPQLLTVGTEDTVVTPASVSDYAGRLAAAGHPVEVWEHAGRPHAFLDSGINRILGIRFEEDAPPALAVMLRFLDGVFYPRAAAP